MLPASSKGGGMAAVFPDVCKTPGPPPTPFTPIPYPNTVQVSTAKSTASRVKIKNKDAVTKSSTFSSTQGDQAGTLKGMISPFTGGKATYRTASSKVKAQGKPMATVLKSTGHNGANPNAPPGAQVAPSQTSVLCG